MENLSTRTERNDDKRLNAYARRGLAALTFATLLSAVPGTVKSDTPKEYDNIVFEDTDDEKIPDMERHTAGTDVITIEPVVTVYSITPKTEAAEPETTSEPVIVEPKLAKPVEIEPKLPEQPAVAPAAPDITMPEPTKATTWEGPVLNDQNGNIPGPSGDETYYNLPMDNIVERMHRMGVEGDYWVRDDGVKMLGDYVMVAANLNVHPRGSIVETSLGTGIVCDTGDFAEKHPQRLDIATNW